MKMVVRLTIAPQGDRKGRPYHTTASQADSSYGKGDPCGRPEPPVCGRTLIAVLLALCLLLLFPGVASAHAILLRSDPAKDAVLRVAPSQVRMWFSEDLNPAFSTASVIDAANTTASNVNAAGHRADNRD